MINRVVKQPCQIASQVRDITSGPWQQRQATAKAVLAFRMAAMRQGSAGNKTVDLEVGASGLTGTPYSPPSYLEKEGV